MIHGVIEKLYDYYFNHTLITMEDLFPVWIKKSRDNAKTKPKTIYENGNDWKKYLKDTDLVKMYMKDIKPKHLMAVFEQWTSNGKMTYKTFTNVKGILTRLFELAIIEDIVTSSPLRDLGIGELNFKHVDEEKKKAFEIEERTSLLNHLEDIKDVYSLAIQFAFTLVIRIGELKAFKWDCIDHDTIRIKKQLTYERQLNDDMTFNSRNYRTDIPKGKQETSIRSQKLSSKAKQILVQMKELNPDGEYIFMKDGKPLDGDEFNKSLKKIL